ncbi:hypothetical protein AMJ57_02105 [Parcubacteria bacterium SG8_24]|nr:MAG: hypothetical protein AMJ57_02105 [Parcubacteria bacterium SG8_24]
MYEQFSSGRKARQAFLYVGLDTLATAVIIALFFLRQDFFSPVNVAMGIIGGLLPDLLVGLYEVYKPRRRWFERKLSWFNDFHMRNHKLVISRVRRFKDDIPLRYSLILQGIALFFLMRAML